MSIGEAKAAVPAATVGGNRWATASEWIWRVFETTALLMVGVPILAIDAAFDALVRHERD